MPDTTRVTNLRCEYMERPLGLGEAQPRLSWELATTRRGARQLAWRVRVCSRPGGPANVWDSGRVSSDATGQILYAGRTLGSRERVWWTVEVWDEKRRRTRSAESWWEMGLLEPEDWQARWIAADFAGGPRSLAPAPYFRRVFTLKERPRRARLYVTALGLHESWLNGRRISDDVLSPCWTDYRRRVYYDVYDVTAVLRRGENVLGAIVGSGWYCGHVSSDHRQQYGDRPRLRAQLEVESNDGSRAVIATDAGWEFATGAILDEDLIMGESHDARRELDRWCEPGLRRHAMGWRTVVVMPELAGLAIEARRGPPMRRQQEVRPVAPPVERPAFRRDRFIFDLGQNLVGRVRLRVRAPAGTTITIRHAEMLDAAGDLYTANLRSARATDHYTCRGNGYEEWEPRFTFHGFRYVELSGVTEPPGIDAVRGVVIHSVLPVTGHFACSDPRLNQLQRNIAWSLRGNFLDVPTDCPQRDERCGWTGDAQVFIRTAAFNCDVAAFFTKWQWDLDDAQARDGAVAAVAPTWGPVIDDTGPAWADAILLCPWTIHERYGDRRILEAHYQAFCRFVDRCARHAIDEIRAHPDSGEWGGNGDWLALDGSGRRDGGTPKDLIGTAFFAHATGLLARVSHRLGRPRESRRYAALASRVRRAFQRRFVSPDGLVAGGTQTAYVLALRFELVPRRLRPRLLAELVRLIESNGDRLSTGFVGTPHLPHVLSENGRADVAYRLLAQVQWPSWLYAVTQGATTIWERWDGWTHDRGFQDATMNSFNHYAYGAVGDWMYSVVAGLDYDPARPGGQRLRIRPRPGGHVEWARARLHTPQGWAGSGWRRRRRGRELELDVLVPPNSTAEVRVPASPAAVVTLDGKPLCSGRGVRVERQTRTYRHVVVTAGTWRFVVGERAGPP